MKLKELLKQCNANLDLENFQNFTVKDISSDSRLIKSNFIFAAISGTKDNGEKYIKDFVRFKNIAVIISKKSKFGLKNRYKDITFIETYNVRKLLSKITSILYKNFIPEKIAITGTNGKTSVCDYTRQIWEKENLEVASIGTLGLIFKKRKIEMPNLTSPDPTLFNKYLSFLSKKKCKKVIVEASSIGLDQERLYPHQFNKVAFTNLTQDHLDYHKSFLDYKESKSLLFQNHTTKNSISVINADDKFSKYFLEICRRKNLKVLDYGRKADFFKFLSLKKRDKGFDLKYSLKKKVGVIFIECFSEYEIYNKICALILVYGNQINFKNFSSLNFLLNPAGRLEKLKNKHNLNIFIDYAHTPDALKNLLKGLKRNCKGKLLSIIGCGGDRDKKKRPLMTKEALTYSDTVIITDDNPRNENPSKIRNEMKKNLKEIDKKNIKEIADREKAIQYSIKLLNKNDFLVITGKGHENYQIYKKKKSFFSDKETALKFIGKL